MHIPNDGEPSNMDLGRFKEEHKATIDLEAAPFKRTKEMMDRAGKFYEDLEESKTMKKKEKGGKEAQTKKEARGKRKRLKEREPW